LLASAIPAAFGHRRGGRASQPRTWPTSGLTQRTFSVLPTLEGEAFHRANPATIHYPLGERSRVAFSRTPAAGTTGPLYWGAYRNLFEDTLMSDPGKEVITASAHSSTLHRNQAPRSSLMGFLTSFNSTRYTASRGKAPDCFRTSSLQHPKARSGQPCCCLRSKQARIGSYRSSRPSSPRAEVGTYEGHYTGCGDLRFWFEALHGRPRPLERKPKLSLLQRAEGTRGFRSPERDEVLSFSERGSSASRRKPFPFHPHKSPRVECLQAYCLPFRKHHPTFSDRAYSRSWWVP